MLLWISIRIDRIIIWC